MEFLLVFYWHFDNELMELFSDIQLLQKWQFNA